jgi:hypothetical protein
LVGCGRIAFDPLGDGGASGDGGDSDSSAGRAPWLVGTNGYIARWDGTAFEPFTSPFTTGELSDLYAPTENEAWALGSAGLAHYDGTQWSSMTPPISGLLSAIWGRAANDLWIASATGLIAHWNGSSWTGQPAPVAAYNGMSGTATDAFAVGDLGQVAHYDGASWATENSNTANDAEDTKALGGEIYAVGEHATLLHRNAAGNWTATATVVPDRWLRDILPLSANNMYVVGEFASVYHYTGSWNLDGIVLPTTIELWSIWGDAPDNVWVCGDQGEVLHFDGTAWSEPPSGSTLTLSDIGY